MSLYALPVTSSDLTQLQDGIQFFTNDAQAQTQATLINNNQGTVFSYAQTLLANNVSTSQVAMGTFAYALGKTDTVAHLDGIATVFLPPQVKFAVDQNLAGGPTVFAAQVYSLALATSFADFRTSLTSQVANNTFVTNTANLTGTNASAIQNFFTVWFNFYTANPIAAPGLTATQAAAASAYGDALGVALDRGPNDTGPGIEAARAIQNAVANALFDIAQTASSPPGATYKDGVPITSLPQHTPFQGEGAGPNTFTLTVGVDGPTGFISTLKGAVFNALPAANGVLGTTNTLNAGDNFGTTGLTDAKDQGTLNFTAVENTLGGNDPLATNVTMSGVSTANITNATGGGAAGFSGNITGLINVNVTGTGTVILGTPGFGLNTALQNVSTNQAFTAWHTADALKGTTDALNLTLNGITGPNTPVVLNNVSGTNGYETVNITSATGKNSILLNTNATSLAKITATGSQGLTIAGTALNIANLHSFDGSAATGSLDVTFNGTGNVAAKGGSADDTFRFLTPGFTKDSSVDGGGGKDTLVTQINAGAILAAGVGPNITNVEVIRHITGGADANGLPTNGTATGALTADMARSGSATSFELAGSYAGQNVSVSNLTSDDSVLYTGPANLTGLPANTIGTLTLAHEAPVVGKINFSMAQTVAGGTLTVDTLVVAPGVVLDLTTAGKAANNDINNVAQVQVSVNVTGGVHLDFGSTGSPYSFKGGVIDASATTGGVQTWLAADSTNVFPGAETFVGGTGNDQVNFLDFRSDTANFASGGSDIAAFRAFQPDPITFAIDSTAFNKVQGFQLDDELDFVVAGGNIAAGGLFSTGGGAASAPVGVNAVLNPLHFTTDAININAAAGNFNYIHIDTPVAAAGQNPAQAFFNAMGTGTIINFNPAGGHQYLASLYDTQTSQAMFFSVNPASAAVTTVLAQNDFNSVETIALVGMSLADYQALGAANIHFTAVV